jgi:Holliday junction resolvase RusA-like endonuclease
MSEKISVVYFGNICPLNAKTNIGGLMRGLKRGRTINVNSARYNQSKLDFAWTARAQNVGKYFQDELLEMSIKIFWVNHEPDIDAHTKIILDSLNGVTYQDDSQIIKCTQEKFKAKKCGAIVEIIKYIETPGKKQAYNQFFIK